MSSKPNDADNILRIIETHNNLIVHYQSLYRASKELHRRVQYIKTRSQEAPHMLKASTALHEDRLKELSDRTHHLWNHTRTLMNTDQAQIHEFENLIPPPKKFTEEPSDFFSIIFNLKPAPIKNILKSKEQQVLLDHFIEKTLVLKDYLAYYIKTHYPDIVQYQEAEGRETQLDLPIPYYQNQFITIHGNGNVIGNHNASKVDSSHPHKPHQEQIHRHPDQEHQEEERDDPL